MDIISIETQTHLNLPDLSSPIFHPPIYHDIDNNIPIIAANASSIANNLISLQDNYFQLPNFIDRTDKSYNNILDNNLPLDYSNNLLKNTAFIQIALNLPSHKDIKDINKTPTLESQNSFMLGIPSNKSIFTLQKPIWIADDQAKYCLHCTKPFSLLIRRHHCRSCGAIICDLCSSNRLDLPFLSYGYQQRVCDSCYSSLSYNMRGGNIEYILDIVNNLFDTKNLIAMIHTKLALQIQHTHIVQESARAVSQAPSTGYFIFVLFT